MPPLSGMHNRTEATAALSVNQDISKTLTTKDLDNICVGRSEYSRGARERLRFRISEHNSACLNPKTDTTTVRPLRKTLKPQWLSSILGLYPAWIISHL